ncbi:MAG TPA: PilZ domain-containing protein [Geobacter sp.]|nr:PilZ domain-containing protein [Geobacter sp.]
MQKEPCNYRDYFHAGQKARLEVSLSTDKVFNEGAVVTAVGENQIHLRLSRERRPDEGLIPVQAPLVVRVGLSGNSYSCRGVIVNEKEEELKVAFVDRVTPEDQREYFRFGTEIPVILFNVTAGTAEESGAGGLRVASHSSLPRIVNISGGGLRTETEMTMTRDDIVYATFHLPLPEPKVVPVVAQVMHSELIKRGEGQIQSAGLRFMHINERDRDAIVRYVCNEEIKRIRLCRKDFYSLPSN